VTGRWPRALPRPSEGSVSASSVTHRPAEAARPVCRDRRCVTSPRFGDPDDRISADERALCLGWYRRRPTKLSLISLSKTCPYESPLLGFGVLGWLPGHRSRPAGL